MAFFVSLPWSLAVWFVMILPAITGMDGPAVLIPSFFVMPIVAGICWASILAKILQVRPGR
jgi:hypothetical protein